MEIDEAIEIFRQTAESQTIDKEDFINDCFVLFLEGLTAEEAIRKTRNKRIRQTYEKRRFANPIINDDGEDFSDNIYFVDQSTIEHNDGNTFKAKYPDAEKIATTILLTNALMTGRYNTTLSFIRRSHGKIVKRKTKQIVESDLTYFKKNNRFPVLSCPLSLKNFMNKYQYKHELGYYVRGVKK